MPTGVFQGKAGLVPRALVVDMDDEKALQEAAKKVRTRPAPGSTPCCAFPTLYHASNAPSSRLQQEVKIKRCQAIRSHAPGKDGWLDFDMGDIVLVPKPNESSVWQGVCKGERRRRGGGMGCVGARCARV